MLPFNNISLYLYKNQIIKDDNNLSNKFRSFHQSTLNTIKEYNPSTYNAAEVIINDKIGTVEKIKTIAINEVIQTKDDIQNGLTILFKKGVDIIGYILKYLLNNPYIIGSGIILLIILLKK